MPRLRLSSVRTVSVVIAMALFTLSPVPGRADVRLPAIFADHMVVQQQSEIVVWGWAAPEEEVTVEASWGAKATATTGVHRGWRVRLETPAADGAEHTLTVRGRTTETIHDVRIGEVWLASGQSNMEMPVGDHGSGYRGVRDSAAEIDAASHPDIRCFDVRNTIAASGRIDCSGQWVPATP
ncbi:MAG: hypothetical protein KDC38_14620, partial [Planctomycetes bacterium]|nr:hypothetical protein [Planctomycetota bacterium]